MSPNAKLPALDVLIYGGMGNPLPQSHCKPAINHLSQILTALLERFACRPHPGELGYLAIIRLLILYKLIPRSHQRRFDVFGNLVIRTPILFQVLNL